MRRNVKLIGSLTHAVSPRIKGSAVNLRWGEKNVLSLQWKPHLHTTNASVGQHVETDWQHVNTNWPA